MLKLINYMTMVKINIANIQIIYLKNSDIRTNSIFLFSFETTDNDTHLIIYFI